MTPMSNDPAEARKRRKEIIQSQRSENELIANGVAALAPGASAVAAESGSNGSNPKITVIGAGAEDGTKTATTTDAAAGGNPSEKKPPKKRKMAAGDAASSRKTNKKNGDNGATAKSKKSQIRYDPEVPMSKDQLAAWRREARRVRNRESAAASRQRIRNRISELEDEVGEWKDRYTEAVRRLEGLEKAAAAKAAAAAAAAAAGQQQEQQQGRPRDQDQQQQQPPEKTPLKVE